MTFGLIIAVVMNGVAYFFSDKIALQSSGAQPVTREQLPRLYAVMERLAAKGNLPMPKLYVIPQPAPNAFATGRNPSHASVAVTAGLHGTDERRRTRRRHRARAFPRPQLRHSDHVDCRHAGRRDHLDRDHGPLGHDLWRLTEARATIAAAEDWRLS